MKYIFKTKKNIQFNSPYFSFASVINIIKAVKNKSISGDGYFTKKCHQFFYEKYNFPFSLLTTSCTDALELSALLLNIQKNDEIIMPSFTFVSSANAFVLRGAKIKFVDSCSDNPNIDISKIESLINKKTKAILIVHYAGMACDINGLLRIKNKYNIPLVEDCAHAIDSYYKGKPLGSFGDLSTFSFHDTKNITSGEGGLLVINNKNYCLRAEILREKGTNRSQFFRGEINKYGWVDIGSSFLPSDLTAAYLYGQLIHVNKIQNKRKLLYDRYVKNLGQIPNSLLPIKIIKQTDGSSINAHMFYILLNSKEERDKLILYLKEVRIQAVFHYDSLHRSHFYRLKHDGRKLKNSDHFSDTLLRLPLHYYLKISDIDLICNRIISFFNEK